MPLEQQEQPRQGLPSDFDDTRENLLSQKKRAPTQYANTLREIRNMTEGGNADGIREEYYPLWSDEHFTALLKELSEQ